MFVFAQVPDGVEGIEATEIILNENQVRSSRNNFYRLN